MLLFCADSYSATRKNVNMPSKQSVLDGSGTSFQTPNGDAAYYGQEFVDYHTAGRRFNAGDNPGSSGSSSGRVPVKLKPQLVVPKAPVAAKFISRLKGGPAGIAAGLALDAMLGAVDGFIDANTGAPMKEGKKTYETSDVYWCHQAGTDYCDNSSIWRRKLAAPTYFPELYSEQYPNSELCSYTFTPQSNGLQVLIRFSFHNPGQCSTGAAGSSQVTYYRRGSCPAPSVYDDGFMACVESAPVPLDESDYDLMTAYAIAQNSAFIKSLLHASCNGSPSPGSCYDELSQWGQLQGPASQTDAAQSRTTTTRSPDGTVTATTQSIQNTYNYRFDQRSYDYSTKTTTRTTVNGETIESETSDEQPEDEQPSDEEEEGDYSFSDSDFPDVEPFYEQKYPDGFEGVWDQFSADVDQSAFMQFLQGFIPSFSGSCPAFGLGFNIATWASYGNVQFSSICYVLDFVKIILLVTAVFTFRKVTFGG